MLNYKHKDRLFVRLFGREEHKDWILSLYNAVNGTSYTDPEAIEINTMEDVVYMGVKNDVSFLLGHEISIYEHQSTYNPNMPLRMLIYIGRLYDKYTKQKRLNIYGETRIHVPLPKLVVFYNGTKNMPDEMELHLRDAFPEGMDKDQADITLRVRMLNINYDKNRKLMENCKPLSEYAWFIDRIRKHRKTKDVESAVDEALDEMPKGFAIRNYLIGNRTEVKMGILTEYDEAETMEMFKEEAREEGRKEATEELVDIYAEMKAAGRDADAERFMMDAAYRKQVLAERAKMVV